MKTRTEVDEKEKPAKTTAKKRPNSKSEFAFSNSTKTKHVIQRRFWFCFLPCLPTVCVTCAGVGRRSRPARKMIRRRKLPGMCAESPASGARFVGRLSIKSYVSIFTFLISVGNEDACWREQSRYCFRGTK